MRIALKSTWHRLNTGLLGGIILTGMICIAGGASADVQRFESVGAILVIAFLSGPPAIAYLLVEDFKKMLILSCIIGILCSIGGYYFAKWLDVSVAGSISIVIGIAFVFVFFIQSVVKRKVDVISA